MEAKIEEVIWEDIECVAFVEIANDPPKMEFTVLEISGEDEKGKYYEIKNADSSDDTTYNRDNAQPLITGFIKWDGCSHINFGNEGYIHLCGGSDWIMLMEATRRIWQIALKRLPREHSYEMFLD